MEDVSPGGPGPWPKLTVPAVSLCPSCHCLCLSFPFSQPQYLNLTPPFMVHFPPTSSSAQASSELSPGFSHLPQPTCNPPFSSFLPSRGQWPSPFSPRFNISPSPSPNLSWKSQQTLPLLASLHSINTPRYLTSWIVLESASHPCFDLVSSHLLLELFSEF